jgi:antitoxin component YwqK of YwqJK toxin-antitoxin module
MCVSGGISDYREGWDELVAEASSPANPDIPFDERWGEAAPRPSDQVRLEDEYVLVRETGELYSGSVFMLFSCMYGSPRMPYMNSAGGCTWRSRDPNSNNYDSYVFTDGIPHPQHPGQIRVRYNVTNGKRDGPYEEYYPKQISSIFTNSSGKLRIKLNYLAGELDGPYEEYYANGSLRIKSNYVAGELHGPYEQYSRGGRCQSFIGSETGKWSRPPLCLPSQLEEKATYQNGVLDGPFEAYYHDGLLRQKSTYTNGVLDGPTEFYWPSGILWGQVPPRNIDELVLQGGAVNPTYLDPETFEPWTGPVFKLAQAAVYRCDLDEYSYPGQVQTRLNLKDGKPDGEYESYWMDCYELYDGLLKERGVYRDGQLDGPFERYVWDEFRGQEGTLTPHLAQRGTYRGGSYPVNFGYSDICGRRDGGGGSRCVKNSHGEIYLFSADGRGVFLQQLPAGVVVGALEEYRWNGSPAELSRVPSTEEPVPVQAADPGSTFSAPSAEERVPAQADDPGSAFSIATASDDLDESLLAQLGSYFSDIENANEDVSIGPMFHSFLGDLSESGRETVSLTFPENERLLFYGVCDNDCEDLDLVVKDAAGNVLAEDTLDDSFPQTVLTTGSGGTTVQVEVSMAKCTVEPCYYAVGVSRIN